MNYEIIDCENKTAWEKALNTIPNERRSVFCTSDFIEIFSEKMNGKGKCFFFSR